MLSAAETRSLRALVDADHLGDEALARDHHGFCADGIGLVVIDAFLVAPVADRLAQFLQHEAIFEHEYGLYSTDGAVPRDRWEAAGDDDRFFRYGRLVGVSHEHRLSENVLTYLHFRHAFQQPPCRDYFELLSGMALTGSDDVGAHRLVAGDYLRPHSDDNRNRALAIVLYLTPGWQSAWGGELSVLDSDGELGRIEPAFNRLVAFDVHGTTHAVAPVGAGAGAARHTIGGWYHRPTVGGRAGGPRP